MVKKYISIIFLLCLFSSMNSFEWLTFNYTTNSVEKEDTQTNSFGVSFPGDATNIPYYIKIEATSENDDLAPRLSYSTKDQNCKDPREQLAKNTIGKKVVIWVQRDEFEGDEQNLYALVECLTDNCKYTIRFTGAEKASFDPNFTYTYLVNKGNKNMNFEIVGDVKNIYLSLGFHGSTTAEMNIENVYVEGTVYKTGRAVTFYIDESVSTKIAAFSIKNAAEGDYIIVSGHILDNKEFIGISENVLVPNGPDVIGYLEDQVLIEECFKLDLSLDKYKDYKNFYITGKIHTLYTWFYIEDEDRHFIDNTDTEVTDGQLSFLLKNEHKLIYICLEVPKDPFLEPNHVAYQISLQTPETLPEKLRYYDPMLPGVFYRRMLPKNGIAFYSGVANDNSAKKYDYNLQQIVGLTKMYIAKCDDYPDCNYNEEELKNLIQPKPINRMTIWTTNEDKSSVLNPEKYVIVVQCVDSLDAEADYCEFETSIFSKGQTVIMTEKNTFSKFLIAEEEGSLKVDLQYGMKVQSLLIDIMIMSGDVTFTLRDNREENNFKDEPKQISYDSYLLSNKVFIHIDTAQTAIKEIVVDYVANLNSFFTAKYTFHSVNKNQLSEILHAGENYLVQIDSYGETKSKTVQLTNRFKNSGVLYMANFFALNCEYEVTRENKKVEFYDGYAQEILTSSEEGYNNPTYDYKVKIIEQDLSNYNNKMCMIYVSGYEDSKDYDREIVVGENINQQFIFENGLSKVRFLYPHADPNKDLAVHFNVIDQAVYEYKILVNMDEEVSSGTVTRKKILFVAGTDISVYCQQNILCPIVVQVEYKSDIVKTNPMIEVTIREVKNTPTYLQKGQAKLDFVCGDKLYYFYTDIGKNDKGEITVNFLREFGYIWSRLVKKTQTSVDEKANWRGKYRLPTDKDNENFNGYTKKLTISEKDTADCVDGCYLLLTIQVSQIGDYVEDYKFYPFSIITRILPGSRAYTDIPKVVIQTDEFIIGNVDVAENERIYEFYEVWLPHDSDFVEFDFQSSVAGLYINLGGTRPTAKNAHFKLLPPGENTILTLTKEDILNKAKERSVIIPQGDKIQDMSLVIGIWTDKTDSINSELYSLRVHQTNQNDDNALDIIEVNTDQKILCNPTKIEDGEYRCLFMITYDDVEVDFNTPFLGYGASMYHGALSYMFADFVQRDIYDQYKSEELIQKIPTEFSARFNSKKDGVDYIYIPKLESEKYLFINVRTDRPEPIMIITSMPIYNYISFHIFEFYPNTFTEQLLSVGDELSLAFQSNNSISVNIITLAGNAELYWKNDPGTLFSLRGNGDRVTLSSGRKKDELFIKKINITTTNNALKETMEDPGFLFYISYKIRDSKKDMIDFNEILYGKSLEISYKDTDLPVVLYSKVGTRYNDINIAVTFNDNEVDNQGEHHYNPIGILAQLVKEKIIYESKKDKDLIPFDKASIGVYDPALRTGHVFMDEETIKRFNIKESDNPSIYLRIDKYGDFKEKTFSKFKVEAQISGVNDGVIPVEKVYHYGSVRNTPWQQTVYRLRINKNKRFMRIHLAFNSNNLGYVISEDESDRRNVTFKFIKKERGKIVITVDNVKRNKEFLYLIIFKRGRTTSEKYLNNYAFKYINAQTEEEFMDYEIDGKGDLIYSEETISVNDESYHQIKVTFNKLKVPYDQANVTYFLKVVANKTLVYGEEVNTIAVTTSNYHHSYERNPKDIKGKITLTATSLNDQYDIRNWAYLNIIAQVQQKNIIEYVSYNGVVNIRPPPKDPEKNEGGSSNTVIFVTIGSILAVIVIGLVVTIFIFQRKNQQLLNQVKHVSFQQTNTNTDPNLLLQKNNN